jgi:hypothetical protein
MNSDSARLTPVRSAVATVLPNSFEVVDTAAAPHGTHDTANSCLGVRSFLFIHAKCIEAQPQVCSILHGRSRASERVLTKCMPQVQRQSGRDDSAARSRDDL